MRDRLGALVCCLAVALASAAARGQAPVPQPVGLPMRVMSINQCTDQIVLALLPPYRIISVSWLARDPHLSMMRAQAEGVGINHGQAEDVVLQKPDLVIADTFASATTRAMLRRLGYPLVEVTPPTDVEGVRVATRRIAAAIGDRKRGEYLIARMDQQLAELRRLPPVSVPVAAWDSEGLSGSKGRIYDAILEAAGARDVGSATNGGMAGSNVEALLAAAPAFLLVEGDQDGLSLRDTLARHPIVRRYWADRMLPFARSSYICGTPFIGDMAIALRAQLQAAGARSLRSRIVGGRP